MTYMTLAFDTLKYANKLKTVGVPAQQAEAQAEALAELVTDQLANKQDLQELRLATKRDMQELESRMTIKLGGMIAASLSMLVILMKLFNL